MTFNLRGAPGPAQLSPRSRARYPAAMAQITNLNRFRKDRARADKRRQGDENAAKYGRSKAERAQETAEAARAARVLDQHRCDSGDADDA